MLQGRPALTPGFTQRHLALRRPARYIVGGPILFRDEAGVFEVEFIKFDEASEALRELGIEATLIDDEHMCLVAAEDAHPEPLCHLHIADGGSGAPARNGARVINVEKGRIADAALNMIGQLHLSQILLIPVGKWRSVFDAVAFSMASNEEWQAVDAMATVELNTRDPLLCEPGDYHTLHALIDALLQDAQSPDQGFTIAATATPFLAEIVPEGAVRVTVGNEVMADEIEEGLRA